MKTRGLVVNLVVVALVAGSTPARARSLSSGIEHLFGDLGIQAAVDSNGVPHQAHFTSQSLATFGLLVRQLAANAADFPAVSTVPGFIYRYNPKLEIFERATDSLGPVFVERARTLGAGKLDVGASYVFVDFDELDGADLDHLQFPGLHHNDCCNAQRPPPSPDFPAFERDTADLFFEKFELRSHVVDVSATYGVTDRLDVNFLLPVVFTSLDLRARAQLNDESGTNTHFFDLATRSTVERRSLDDDKIGVGDLQLRTKYHLFGRGGFNVAPGLSLGVPTGGDADFQGLGDTTLTSFVTLSQIWGMLDAHASGGIEVNFDDSDRSRIRYAGGLALQPVARIALLTDVIGSSNLQTDRIGVRAPQFVNAGANSAATPTTLPATVRLNKNLSTDTVDLALGFKVHAYGPLVGFFTVLLPLHDDGLQADLIPAGGFEASF